MVVIELERIMIFITIILIFALFNGRPGKGGVAAMGMKKEVVHTVVVGWCLCCCTVWREQWMDMVLMWLHTTADTHTTVAWCGAETHRVVKWIALLHRMCARDAERILGHRK